MSPENKRNIQTYYGNKKKLWSETDKRTLLKGLRKYGSEDISSLKSFFPYKSTTAITQMIRKYQAIAELGKKDVNSPLDVWLRSGIFDEGNYLIPEALLFIRLCESHPPPNECAGFDLKAAYKFLYEASERQQISNMPRKTAEMLKQLIMAADNEDWPANELTTTDYLINKLSAVKESEKSYSSKKLE